MKRPRHRLALALAGATFAITGGVLPLASPRAEGPPGCIGCVPLGSPAASQLPAATGPGTAHGT